MKEFLDPRSIIECQKQNVTIDDGSISMIDTIHDLERENLQLKEQLDLCLNSKDFINQIRKQVCDEIREYIAKEYGTTVEDITKIYHHLAWTVKEIYELLDQVEAKESVYS